MKFKKDNYVVAKKVVSKEIAQFLFNYLLIRRQCLKTLTDTKQISPFDYTWGVMGDKQVDDTFGFYADLAMETLLLRTVPIMEKQTGLKLIPTYSYCRLYKHGDELKRHKDRASCEISTTLFLGGEPWPIFLSPYENVGHAGPKTKATFSSKAKGIKVNLDVGDMLIYKGAILEHWREKFGGTDCAQVFLHYNTDSPENRFRQFDTRPHVGLPSYCKQPGA